MTDEQSTVPMHPRLEHLAHDLERFRAFVRGRVVDPQHVEEILQDAFARAAKSIDQLRDAERLDAWFYRILRNRIADLGSMKQAVPIADDLLAPEGDVAAACLCFAPLIDRLPIEHAAALRLVDLQGLKPEEAALQLGISVNALNVRRHRARLALKTLLEVACGMCGSEGCRDCACGPTA